MVNGGLGARRPAAGSEDIAGGEAQGFILYLIKAGLLPVRFILYLIKAGLLPVRFIPHHKSRGPVARGRGGSALIGRSRP